MLHIARDHAGPPLDPYGRAYYRRKLADAVYRQLAAEHSLAHLAHRGRCRVHAARAGGPAELAGGGHAGRARSRDRSGRHQLRRRGLGIRAVGDDLDIANGSTLSAS